MSTIRFPRSPRSGISLIEVVFSTLLVSVVLLGATNMLGAIINGRTEAGDQQRAESLAQQLLTEILDLPYEDPELGGGTLGPESGETTGTRSAFDDVDDYHGWTESPPESKTGVSYPEFDGWTRRVTVRYVTRVAPDTVASSDQGLKRVRVFVDRDGKQLAWAVGLKGRP